MSILTNAMQVEVEVLASTIRSMKGNERRTTHKEMKLVLSADDVLIYIENPKTLTKKTTLTNKRVQ